MHCGKASLMYDYHGSRISRINGYQFCHRKVILDPGTEFFPVA
jgi:hypothetical protein